MEKLEDRKKIVNTENTASLREVKITVFGFRGILRIGAGMDDYADIGYIDEWHPFSDFVHLEVDSVLKIMINDIYINFTIKEGGRAFFGNRNGGVIIEVK